MSPRLFELPPELALRCVAVLPVADGTRWRCASRTLNILGGAALARCRARLGICELRLVGSVAGDPRKSTRAGRTQESARISLGHPQAASKAKELFRIKGPDLEAVVEDVDRTFSARDATGVDDTADVQNQERQKLDEPVNAGGLRDWGSQNSLNEFEAYAVLEGCLHLVGPMHLGGRRWMMRMRDAEKRFAQVQNARLYIANIGAEYCHAVDHSSLAVDNGRSCASLFLPNDDVNSKGIRGRLLFCAVEI